MRRPCPLYLDLIELILESQFNKQRVLHFPWFRHAGTRVGLRASRRMEMGHTCQSPWSRVSILSRQPERGADDLAGLRADAGADRPDRAPSDTPQMVLFPADVSGEVDLGSVSSDAA